MDWESPNSDGGWDFDTNINIITHPPASKLSWIFKAIKFTYVHSSNIRNVLDSVSDFVSDIRL